MGRWRVLVISGAVTLAVIGMAAVIGVLAHRGARMPQGAPATPPPDRLANSDDPCVKCHRRSTPGIVEQYARSTMAAAGVTCRDCHEVPANTPGALDHEGARILASPTTERCGRCHQAETRQFYQSRHSLPAYVAFAGAASLSPEHRQMYEAIPEGGTRVDERAILFQLEGAPITRFACESCHNIGKPREDGSVGHCEACHLRHEFSLEQARKPETCNACHIGPDHPQWEIYIESKHGILYHTDGANWRWNAAPGTLTPADFPAPTCATCHFGGFGGATTTHDVGDRLTWYLFAPISAHRPTWEDNRARMQSVCGACHNAHFISDFYQAADAATEAVNARVKEGDAITKSLKDKNLLTAEPYDEPYDFESFELWHHWGRTAKFGVWMQGPDYTQWHGAYEMLKSLVHMRDMAAQKLGTAKP